MLQTEFCKVGFMYHNFQNENGRVYVVKTLTSIIKKPGTFPKNFKEEKFECALKKGST